MGQKKEEIDQHPEIEPKPNQQKQIKLELKL
jgi:hypothetical protein